MLGRLDYLVLLDVSQSLTAEQKYFLIRLHYLYGVSMVRVPTEQLTTGLDCSEGRYRKLRNSLVELGCLRQGSGLRSESDEDGLLEAVKRRGRPSSSFAIRSDWIGLVQEAASRERRGVAFKHQQQVDKLLLWSTAPGFYLDGGRPISCSTRVLLAVLLMLADEDGIVRDVGLSRLGKLAGMKRDKVENHLARLKTLGLLLAWTPGVTGVQMLGVTGSLFVLDIFNPCFELERGRRLIAAYRNRFGFCMSVFGMAWHMRTWLISKKPSWREDDVSGWSINDYILRFLEEIKKCKNLTRNISGLRLYGLPVTSMMPQSMVVFFGSREGDKFLKGFKTWHFKYLQALIDFCASDVLNEGMLFGGDEPGDLDGVLDGLGEVLFPPKIRSRLLADLDFDEGRILDICGCFLACALIEAFWAVVTVINAIKFVDVKASEMRVVILPLEDDAYLSETHELRIMLLHRFANHNLGGDFEVNEGLVQRMLIKSDETASSFEGW